MAEITVKVGRKVEGTPEGKILDGQKPQQVEGGEGQYQYLATVACWNDWSLNNVMLDSEYYVTWRCWLCGCLNTA